LHDPVYPYVPAPEPARPAPTPLETPFGPAQWNEWARASLFERRAVLLDGPLVDAVATRVASELTLLASDGDDPISLRIDSVGGEAGAALILVDVIDLLSAPVHATVLGRADGPALAVLAVAKHRVATPHARLRFGAEDSEYDGRAGDVLAFAQHHRDQVRQLATSMAAVSALDAETLERKILDRDPLPLADAMGWQLLDAVAEPDARVLRLPRTVGYERR
jgi:ATP-dependent Clp protease protease subunit